MKGIERLEIRGSIKGLDSFFAQPLIARLQPDDTLEINGFEWLVTRVQFYAGDRMMLKLISNKDS